MNVSNSAAAFQAPQEHGDGPSEWDDVKLGRGVISTSDEVPIGALLGEIASKTLVVHPKFQRQNIWGRDRQSKLIESIVLNIPIPTLYFAEDDDGIKVVVDGQQRLRAVEQYHAGRYALQRLELLPELNGKRWRELPARQSRAILGRTLRCAVISAASPAALRFELFERLSTGGMPLNDQELRNCVFRGPFNELLHDLVRTPAWLSAVGKADADLRMKHEELALRFFALRSVMADYRPPVKTLLNDFMRSNRNADQQRTSEMAAVFERSLANCLSVFGEHCFRRYVQAASRPARWEANLNRAVFDLQMLVLADLSTQLVRTQAGAIREAFCRESIANAEFSNALSLASADRRAFYARLRVWLVALRAEGIESQLHAALPPP
jgi:hypothetical protein